MNLWNVTSVKLYYTLSRPVQWVQISTFPDFWHFCCKWWHSSYHWASQQRCSVLTLSLYLMNCPQWSSLPELPGVESRVHSSLPTLRSAERKTRCWLCQKPGGSFKERAMTSFQVYNCIKLSTSKEKKRVPYCLFVSLTERCMCLLLWELRADWCASLSNFLLFSWKRKKGGKKCRSGRSEVLSRLQKLLSQHRGFEVRAAYCSWCQK